MQKYKTIALGAIRIILALLFIFSGFVKGVDPWGTAIKLDEYFAAFSMEWLSGSKYVLSIALSSAEMLLGFLLLFNIRIKFNSWVALMFMSGFTIVTFVIAISNPVADCGCFGDAIKLSNWATFWKNIVLLVLSVTLFVSVMKRTSKKCSVSLDFIMVILLASIAVFVGIYSLKHLPIIDFLPYKTGVDITRSMSVPSDASQGEYKTVLIYKNIATSEIREFEVADTTWRDDTVWEFVDSRSEELKKGYTPPIGSFSIFNSNGDATVEILNNQSEVFMVVIDDLSTITDKDLGVIENIKEFASKDNGLVISITTSSLDGANLDIPIYNIDATTLKTLLRAHKGLVVLSKGTILAKWNIGDVPDFRKSKSATAQEYVVTKSRTDRMRDSVLLFLGTIVLLMIYYSSRCRKL